MVKLLKRSEKKSLIILEPCAGLGNRFQAIASAYYLTKEIDGDLIIIWKKECACGISSKRLFQLEKGINVLQINAMGLKYNTLSYIFGVLLRKIFKMRVDELIECESINNLYLYGKEEGIRAFCENKAIYIKSTNQFYDYSPALPHGIYSFISPVPHIKKRVESIMGPFANKRIVGIHIRRTDNLEAINYSTDRAFFSCMLSEIKKDPKVMFYLASDDENVITKYIKMFSNRIIVMENKNLDRAIQDGILDAYVELLCLSRCEKIIGSYGSSYSKLAAQIGNIELEIACVKEK